MLTPHTSDVSRNMTLRETRKKKHTLMIIDVLFPYEFENLFKQLAPLNSLVVFYGIEAETLAVLGEKLEDVHLSAFQPCGKAWQAAITCSLDLRWWKCQAQHRGKWGIQLYRYTPYWWLVYQERWLTNCFLEFSHVFPTFSGSKAIPWPLKACVWSIASLALLPTMIAMWLWPWRAKCSWAAARSKVMETLQGGAPQL